LGGGKWQIPWCRAALLNFPNCVIPAKAGIRRQMPKALGDYFTL
jgi:hypothetical protein